MVRKSRKPRLFQNPKKAMNNLGKSLQQQLLNTGAKAAQDSGDRNTNVKRMPKYLEVTQKRMDKLGVIDLKPFFARSPKRKISKDGGWYLTIPIRRKKRDMSRRMYRELNSINIAPEQQKTVVSKYLYDGRQQSDASLLNYKPKSNNITKIRTGNNRHQYIAYRRVSNKSPASSWVINRGLVTEDNTSKTMVRNVNRLMKWKMKNGFK